MIEYEWKKLKPAVALVEGCIGFLIPGLFPGRVSLMPCAIAVDPASIQNNVVSLGLFILNLVTASQTVSKGWQLLKDWQPSYRNLLLMEGFFIMLPAFCSLGIVGCVAPFRVLFSVEQT
jgi:hypothetical protein